MLRSTSATSKSAHMATRSAKSSSCWWYITCRWYSFFFRVKRNTLCTVKRGMSSSTDRRHTDFGLLSMDVLLASIPSLDIDGCPCPGSVVSDPVRLNMFTNVQIVLSVWPSWWNLWLNCTRMATYEDPCSCRIIIATFSCAVNVMQIQSVNKETRV